MGKIIATFSYIDLPEDVRQVVRDRTAAICERVARQKADVIATGLDLIAIKEQIGHGHFLKWLKVEFPFTPRTAQMWMGMAELIAKCETVSLLPEKTVRLLASPSTPADITQAVIADLNAGRTVDAVELSENIIDARYQQRQRAEKERRVARLSASRRRNLEKEEADRLQKMERQRATRKAASDRAVTILRKLPLEDLTILAEALRDGDPFEILRQIAGAASSSQAA